MRLAYIGPMPPTAGEVAEHGRKLVEAWRQAGNEVVVLTWGSRGLQGSDRHDDVNSPAKGPDPSGVFKVIQRTWPWSWISAGRQCRKVDVVVLPWASSSCALQIAVVLAMARRPTVAIAHGTAPPDRRPLRGVLTRIGLAQVGRIVAHRTMVLHELAELGVERSGTVIPEPVGPDLVSPPLPPRPPLRVLLVDRPSSSHQGLVAEALRLLASQGLDVTLSTASPCPPLAHPVHQGTGEVEPVDPQLGEVGGNRLGSLLAEHHVVLTSRLPATSSPVHLARSAGRPVVVMGPSSPDGDVEGTGDGMIASEADATSVAATLQQVDDQLDHLADAARAATPTWERTASEILTDLPGPFSPLSAVGQLRGAPKAGRRRPTSMLVVAVGLFVVATAVALLNLPPTSGVQWPLLGVAVVMVGASVATSGAEYRVTARLLDRCVGFVDSLRVAVYASAANLLPLPGAALVRMQALRRLGSSTRSAAGSTAVVAVGLAAVAFASVGTFLTLWGHVRLGSLFAAVGGGLLLLLIGLLRRLAGGRSHRLLARVVIVELASVAVRTVRLFVVSNAVGLDVGLDQAAALTLANVASLFFGFFPGGLGIREVLSAALAPVVGMAAAVGTVAAAVDQVVGLATLAALSLVLLFMTDHRREAPGDIEPEEASE